MIHKLVCVLAVVSVALLGEQASGTPTEDLLSLCKNSSTTSLQIAAALKAGADVNAKKEGDWTSLMLAAEHNTNPEVISVLLRAGADVNARDNYGKTALDWAKDNESIKGTQALKELEEATNP